LVVVLDVCVTLSIYEHWHAALEAPGLARIDLVGGRLLHKLLIYLTNNEVHMQRMMTTTQPCPKR